MSPALEVPLTTKESSTKLNCTVGKLSAAFNQLRKSGTTRNVFSDLKSVSTIQMCYQPDYMDANHDRRTKWKHSTLNACTKSWAFTGVTYVKDSEVQTWPGQPLASSTHCRRQLSWVMSHGSHLLDLSNKHYSGLQLVRGEDDQEWISYHWQNDSDLQLVNTIASQSTRELLSLHKSVAIRV